MRSLLKATFNDWYEDRAQRMGAALAYYTIFALTPGLVILMALAGLLLGPGAESQIIEQIRELIGEQGAVAIEAVNFVISFAVITGSFALIFKLLPDVKVAWRDVWLGAAVTSLFFTIGKLLIGLYLGKSAVASAYGAAGSLVVIVVWVYYSAQILLFGAEFTKVWTRRRGSGFVPEKTAIPVTQEARAEQGMSHGARRARKG